MNFLGLSLPFQPNLSESYHSDLIMMDNKIRVIYPEFFPVDCKSVNFQNNKICTDGMPEEWPEGIEHINLSKNQIQEIDFIQWPSTLQTLNLSYNPLAKIPFGLPPSLRELDIQGTKIQNLKNIPSSVQVIHVNGCPLDILDVPESCEIKGLFQPCASSTKEQEHVRDIHDWGC